MRAELAAEHRSIRDDLKDLLATDVSELERRVREADLPRLLVP